MKRFHVHVRVADLGASVALNSTSSGPTGEAGD